jgi:predicted AlkP superfamily pyrophosphatase or phosphodiesterase
MVEGTTQFYELVGRMPAANRYELDFTRALIENEKLGQNGVTDLVVVSLSPNDIQGHQLGPDSDSEEEMILSLDKDLGSFFTWLDGSVGLKNVWLALTADHGIAPIPSDAAHLGIHAAVLNMQKVYASVNLQLNKRYSPGKDLKYLMPSPDLPYIVLDQRTFKLANVDEKTAEDAVAALLPAAVAAQETQPDAPLPVDRRIEPSPQFAGVYTRSQMANGQLPPSEWGRLLAHSYAEHGNWFVMLTLGAYQMEGVYPGAGTTHFSPWSYDRHVPLAFYGEPFAPGMYHGRVAPVDLAATFASLAGVNQPSASVGIVLTQALKNRGISIEK